MKLIKFIFQELNYIFLHDRDETAPLSDYLWFYGFNGFCISVLLFFMFVM